MCSSDLGFQRAVEDEGRQGLRDLAVEGGPARAIDGDVGPERCGGHGASLMAMGRSIIHSTPGPVAAATGPAPTTWNSGPRVLRRARH